MSGSTKTSISVTYMADLHGIDDGEKKGPGRKEST
jgi:hypothetical protein